MRIIQLIDSLRPGGAEKMAVNIANSLLPHVEGSFLCCTRQEGMLFKELKPKVGYVFLNKKNRFDIKAILILKKYIKGNNIDIIHAHGTSYFYACIIKVLRPKIKIVWHDHWGNRANKKIYSFPVLYFCSLFFHGIITVSEKLLYWAGSNLLCKNIFFIPNFLPEKKLISTENIEKNGSWPIIYVANLKEPKNHLNLLKAFKIILKKCPDCILYLVGKKYGDNYENAILFFLKQNDLCQKVFFTGETANVSQYLRRAKLGVISSDSEGLSLSLLEYGVAGLPVVCTDVGENSAIVGQNGKIVEVNNPTALADKIKYYIENKKSRERDAKNFHNFVVKNYTGTQIIPKILGLYNI